jgi:hypothetical protein
LGVIFKAFLSTFVLFDPMMPELKARALATPGIAAQGLAVLGRPALL